MCQTCERLCRGGYASAENNSDQEVEDDSSTDEETREERIKAGLGLTAKGNPNERRTRRGVYAILPEEDTDDEDRVGATEKVTPQVSIQSVDPSVKERKVDNDVASETAVEIAVSSLDLNSLSLGSSVPKPSTLISGDSLHKNRDGHLSDTSSALSSLSDSEKTVSQTAEPSTPSVLQRSHPRMPLSSSSAVISIPNLVPSAGLPASGRSVSVPTTPATSRMSTRSTTASQSKGKLPSDRTPRAKDSEAASPLRSGKRALRSRVPVPLQDGKEQPIQSGGHNEGVTVRQGRQARHSTSSTPVDPGPSDTKRSTSLGSKTLRTKVHSSSVMALVGTTLAQKSQPRVPRCNTCANELRHLVGLRSLKNAIHICARYATLLYEQNEDLILQYTDASATLPFFRPHGHTAMHLQKLPLLHPRLRIPARMKRQSTLLTRISRTMRVMVTNSSTQRSLLRLNILRQNALSSVVRPILCYFPRLATITRILNLATGVGDLTIWGKQGNTWAIRTRSLPYREVLSAPERIEPSTGKQRRVLVRSLPHRPRAENGETLSGTKEIEV